MIWDRLLAEFKMRLLLGLIAIGLGLLTGMPSSDLGWTWRWARQAVQIDNCSEDFTSQMLKAAQRMDEAANVQPRWK